MGYLCRRLINLDQITAGIVEYGLGCRPHLSGRHRKSDAQAFQFFVLSLDVFYLKSGDGDAVFDQRFFESSHGWIVGIRLPQQLRTVWGFRRHYGDPTDTMAP